jgi:hypothetical protein
MVGEVVVMEPGEYDIWLAQRRQGLAERVDTSGGAEFGEESFRGDLVAHGRRLAAVHGCLKCHTSTASPTSGRPGSTLPAQDDLAERGRPSSPTRAT